MKKETYFKDGKNPMPSGEKSGFAKRLEELRNESGLTKEALSKKLNLAKSTYGTYENDKYFPDPKTIRDIAEFYHTTSDYLLGLTDERYIVKPKKGGKARRSASCEIVSDGVSHDFLRGHRAKGPIMDERRLVVEDFFDQKCRRRFGFIQYEPETKRMFEDLVENKEFIEFLKVAYSYTTYSAKIKKEEIRRLKQEKLYEKIFFVDPSGSSMSKVAKVDSRLTIQEVYYRLMHKSLDNMIENLIGKNHYIDELMRLINEERGKMD